MKSIDIRINWIPDFLPISSLWLETSAAALCGPYVTVFCALKFAKYAPKMFQEPSAKGGFPDRQFLFKFPRCFDDFLEPLQTTIKRLNTARFLMFIIEISLFCTLETLKMGDACPLTDRLILCRKKPKGQIHANKKACYVSIITYMWHAANVRPFAKQHCAKTWAVSKLAVVWGVASSFALRPTPGRPFG